MTRLDHGITCVRTRECDADGTSLLTRPVVINRYIICIYWPVPYSLPVPLTDWVIVQYMLSLSLDAFKMFTQIDSTHT